jgi:hypothetical protein
MKNQNKKKSVSKKPRSEKLIVLENKKRFEEIKNEEKIQENLEDEDLEEDIEFSGGFHLVPIKKSRLENIPIGTSLEGGVAFSPRVRERGREGKDYSAKYDKNYMENKYGDKIPGSLYAEKSSEKESSGNSNSNNSNGNGNQ